MLANYNLQWIQFHLLAFISTSQVDKEEVRLRRTINQKKDEYYLDGKHIT